MQLIACGPETPRFPPPYDEVDVYDLQEKVIADILGGVEQQVAAASLLRRWQRNKTSHAKCCSNISAIQISIENRSRNCGNS